MPQRMTIQRQLILDTVKEFKGHPTAKEVYELLKVHFSGISLGTVYRNLNLLAETGEIKKITVSDEADRFDSMTHQHYHLRCKHCGKFFDIDMNYFEVIDQAVQQQSGYQIDRHSILFEGLCKDCDQHL